MKRLLDLCRPAGEQINDGYLEGMGTFYRLGAMGKVYWENHSLLEEVKKARQIDTWP